MAFVQRKNKNKIVFEESSVDKSSGSETLRKNQINSEELIANLKRKEKTYLDMTIDVLNTLDSQGINIYDTNRTPGMYQKGREGIEAVQRNNIIKSLLKDNKNSGDFVEDDKAQITNQNNNVNNLLAFFKKDK